MLQSPLVPQQTEFAALKRSTSTPCLCPKAQTKYFIENVPFQCWIHIFTRNSVRVCLTFGPICMLEVDFLHQHTRTLLDCTVAQLSNDPVQRIVFVADL